jgi:hypothetical protein
LILAEGRGSKLARDLPRSGSKVRQLGVPEKPHQPGLLPVPGRSRDKVERRLGRSFTFGRIKGKPRYTFDASG